MKSYEIDTDKLRVGYIVPEKSVGLDADADSSVLKLRKKKKYKIDIEAVIKDVETTVCENFSFKYEIFGGIKRGWNKGWYLIDLVSVFVHIIAFVIMVAPILAITIFFETQYSRVTVADYNKAVTIEDFI